MSTNFNDDDIDESFIETKPEQVKVEELEESTPYLPPQPLLPEEVQQVQSILSSKSVKEHLEYLTKVMIALNPQINEFQQVQVETTVKKNFGDKSKRELNKAIFNSLNQNNKHVFLQKKEEVKQEEPKLSREELKNKLHNKLKMTNKNNLKEMYEKLQEEMEKNNINLDGTQNAPENNGEEGEAVESEANKNKKKKKKKKLNLAKLDPKQLQNQLINQMTSYMKNTPFGGSV